ncbi:MAG: hypothetical protein KGZ58_03945 [Ignavibacteriales bacterium]|nr:hypothetical protein [Ignavibacteriales bacterium]
MNSIYRHYFFPLILLIVCWPNISSAQQIDTLTELQKAAPNIFLDCDYCDEDYIKKEIPFVNFVRDPEQAQVHLLVTTQETGSGGRENTLTFIGKNKFEGMNDTLSFTTQLSATSDERREAMTRVLKVGFVPYVLKTPLRDKLSVSYSGESKQEKVKDDWDYWVFNIDANTYLNGESSSDELWLSGGFSANRTTEEWKMGSSFYSNYNQSHSNYGSVNETTIQRGQGFSSFLVKSLDENWSAGSSADASSSSFSNNKFTLSLTSGVEYNLFPYSESTRRQLRFQYRAKLSHFRYDELTLDDRMKETRLRQLFSISLLLKQPWGSTEASVEASNYFHDFKKRRIEVYTELSIRIIEGLSFRLYGRYAKINDQLSLRKGNVSAEDVLLRRKQLATSYNYFSSVGLSYSFGSIYNNVVNTRFEN